MLVSEKYDEGEKAMLLHSLQENGSVRRKKKISLVIRSCYSGTYGRYPKITTSVV